MGAFPSYVGGVRGGMYVGRKIYLPLPPSLVPGEEHFYSLQDQLFML